MGTDGTHRTYVNLRLRRHGRMRSAIGRRAFRASRLLPAANHIVPAAGRQLEIGLGVGRSRIRLSMGLCCPNVVESFTFISLAARTLPEVVVARVVGTFRTDFVLKPDFW